jgi:hypothetical protein
MKEERMLLLRDDDEGVRRNSRRRQSEKFIKRDILDLSSTDVGRTQDWHFPSHIFNFLVNLPQDELPDTCSAISS